MNQPATRLITLIMLLQRQPNQKAADLARTLGISVRSLHRYFAMLDEMGIPVYTERGPHGGFSLVRGYKMPPLMFSPEEATALYLGTSLVEEMWGSLYREAAAGALAKLDNVLPDEQRQEAAWARRTLVATGMHRADLEALAPTLETLRSALREQRCLSIQYQGVSPQADQREINPYALVHRWGWWYLIAYCHLRQEMRSFRVDRIVTFVWTDQTFDRPADFDLQAYLAQEWKTQPHYQVCLLFTAPAAHIARYNRAFWESFEPQPDGSVLVRMQAPDLYYAAGMALSYGPGVKVLEPPELQRMVIEWAQETAAQYATP